jgi:hypothetical protein
MYIEINWRNIAILFWFGITVMLSTMLVYPIRDIPSLPTSEVAIIQCYQIDIDTDETQKTYVAHQEVIKEH